MPAPVLLANRYRLDAVIGRGGMGLVWQGFDELLRRPVAVKEVDYPAGISDEERGRLANRTLREARAVAAVETLAAVRVFDVVEQDGKPWLVMELIRGRSLSEILTQRGPLPSHVVARIGLSVLTALEAAHAAGVLHRDVKPGNVLIGDDGRVALTDFGIATVANDPSETTTSMVLGSPSYISPERAKGQPPTPASDIWALGATLWTAAEGRPPYTGDNPLVVLQAVAYGDPPPCQACDPRLRDLLLQMMDQEPQRRLTPAGIRQALSALAGEPQQQPARPARVPDRTAVLPPAAVEPVAAAPAAVTASTGHRSRRWALAGLAAAAVAAIVVGVVLATSGSPPATSSAGSRQQGRTSAANHHHAAL